MRLNLKDIAKIIDNENISFSSKQKWIHLYFNQIRANKRTDQIDYIINNVLKTKCSYLKNDIYKLYFCTDSESYTLETQYYYNDENFLISFDEYDRNYFCCEDCEAIRYRDDQNYIDSNNSTVCHDCYDRNYRYCEDCEYSHHESSDCNCETSYEDEEQNLKSWNYAIQLLNLGYMALR